jgi:hypothetical protein
MGILNDPYDKPRCRVCGQRVRMLVDETAGKHQRNGRTCTGWRHPIKDTPPCTDLCRIIGEVGWPDPDEPDQPHASTVVCDSPTHQAEAAAWVKTFTGHLGVFTPYRRGGKSA